MQTLTWRRGWSGRIASLPLSFFLSFFSFIHSYSFNVQVDITQLQTDREARKEDRIIYICSS